jgi:hypothetical protein
VLLGDTEEADFFFKQLDPKMRGKVKKWPIWTLHDQGLPDHPKQDAPAV